MITIITLKRKKELESAEKRLADLQNKFSEAYRWLSSYDWFLKPFWSYILSGKTSIEKARDEMNNTFLQYVNSAADLAVQKIIKKQSEFKLLGHVQPKSRKTAKKTVKKKISSKLSGAKKK